MQGPFAKNASWQLAACLCTLRLPCHGPSWLLFALPCIFKNKENARTIRPKSSQASGWHAKRPDMQFHLCFTGQTGPWAQNTPVFTATFGGSQGPPGRAPRGLQEASLQPCPQEAPKRPPRGHREATERPPRGPKRPPRAHTCSHTCPPARWPTCTHVFAHVHTHSHMCTHVHTCSHMFTPAQTSSHMFTHVHTCLHMFTHAPHGNALPVLALTGLCWSSF